MGVRVSEVSGAVENWSISVQVSFGVGSSAAYGVVVRVAWSGMGWKRTQGLVTSGTG